MKNLARVVRDEFPRRRIVIVGDLVADQFLNGTISRVSREAPVFILKHETTVTLPGAAANAAANIASLGASVAAVGVTGDDETGKVLRSKLDECGVVSSTGVIAHGVITTRKVRVLAGQHYAARQQVIRIDYEEPGELPEKVRSELVEKFGSAAREADAIIISDYNYGAVFAEMIDAARSVSSERNIPLVVDSRFRLASLEGATTATPNREEVEQIIGPGFDDAACSALRERLGLEALLVTNGNEGVKLFQAGSETVSMPAVGPLEPVDVTGAGDTVIAAYALSLASGLGFVEAATIANHAGGLVVMTKGTATVSPDELIASLDAALD